MRTTTIPVNTTHCTVMKGLSLNVPVLIGKDIKKPNKAPFSESPVLTML